MNYLLLLGLLSGVVSAQATPTECTCVVSYTGRPKAQTRTLTGTSSCSRFQAEATCATFVIDAAPVVTAVPHIEVRKHKKRQNASTTTSPSSSSTRTSTTVQAATTTAPPTSRTSSTSSTTTTTTTTTTTRTSTTTTTTTTTRTSTTSTRTSTTSTTSTTPSASTTTARSTSSSTTSSACVPSPTVSSGKRGLSFEKRAYTNFFSQSCSTTNSKVNWGYNWYSSLNDPQKPAESATFNSALKYIPLLWSNATVLTDVWNTNARAAISAGADSVLGFNEPDLCGGGGSACMSVASAVTTYRQYITPLRSSSVRLGSPAVTNSDGDGQGLQWLSSFLTSCTNCNVDFIVIHWYGGSFSQFQTFVQNARAQFPSKPIWITEFALDLSNTAAAQLSFAQSALPWLDRLSYVERYALFGTLPGYEITSDGTGLTDIGKLYNS